VKKQKQASKLIEPFLNNHFESFSKLSEIAAEITFLIPQSELPSLKTFFEEFDQNLDRLDILSYGVSITTLEEVFCKINEELAPDLFTKVDISRRSEAAAVDLVETSEILKSNDTTNLSG
jgi:hypothetical protein